MLKDLKSNVKNRWDRLKKIVSIFISVTITAYLFCFLMILLVTYIPEAKFFLMDKDGYYNVTLIGTLIAGIALIVNVSELTRKAKDERERYERDRNDERERYKIETRRQIEKERIDRLHRAFYNYYKIAHELVAGYDEIITCLKGIVEITTLSEDDKYIQLIEEEFNKRFIEAQSVFTATYKFKVWIAGREFVWQILDSEDNNPDSAKNSGMKLKASVERLSEGVQKNYFLSTKDINMIFNNAEMYIDFFKGTKTALMFLLKNTERAFQKYLAEEIKRLENLTLY